MGDPREKLKKLHSNLVAQGFDIPEYSLFEKYMEDGNKLLKLHENLTKEGYDLPDFNTFQSDMGYTVKKKEPSGIGGSLGSSASRGEQSNVPELPIYLIPKSTKGAEGVGGGAAAAIPPLSVSKNIAKGISSQIPSETKQTKQIREALETVSKSTNQTPVADEDTEYDANDPVRPIFKKFEERRRELQQSVSDISSQSLDAKKQLLTDEVSMMNEGEAFLRNDLFKTSTDAKNWLKNHPASEDNTTSQIAMDVVNDEAAVLNAVDKSPNLSKAAIKYYLETHKGEKMADNLSVILESGEQIPPQIEGGIVASFMQNKRLRDAASRDPNLKAYIRFNEQEFMHKYPDHVNQMILSKIAQGREDLGMNNWFFNVPGVKSSDKVIALLKERGEISAEEEEFYNKRTRKLLQNGVGDIPTTGFIESSLKSAARTIEGIPKGVYEMTGLRDAIYGNGEILSRDMAEEAAFTTPPKAKGFNRFSSASANLIGVVLPIGGQVKALKALGFVGKGLKGTTQAHEIATALTFYNDIHKAERQANPDNPLLAHLSALIQTGVWSKFGKVFQGLTKSVIKDAAPEVNNILKSLQSSQITGKEAAAGITDMIANAAGGTVNTASQIAGITALNSTISQIISGRHDFDEVINNGVHTWEEMMLGAPLLELSKAAGSNRIGSDKMIADYLNEIALNPEKYKKRFMDNPELLKNFEHLMTANKELSSRTDLSPEQKKKYQMLWVKEKILEGEREKVSSDKELSKKDTEEINEQLKEVKEEKQAVLDEKEKDSAEVAAIKKALKEKTIKDEMSANAALNVEGGADMLLKNISDQALNRVAGDIVDPMESMRRAKELYGPELVDMAVKKYPAEKETQLSSEEAAEWGALPMQEKLRLAQENLPAVEGMESVEMVREADKNAKMLLEKLKQQEPIDQDRVLETEPVSTEQAAAEPKKSEPVSGEGSEKPRGRLTADKFEAMARGEGGASGVHHKATESMREEFGLPERKTDVKKDEVTEKEADELIEKGFNVHEVLSRIEKGDKTPTDAEYVALKRYALILENEVRNNPSSENLAFLQRFAEAMEAAGTESGRELRQRRGLEFSDESIAGMFLTEMEASGIRNLTEAQKMQVKREYEEIGNAREKFEEWRQKKEAEFAEREAALTIQETAKKTKKEKKDYTAERKQIVENIREKLKQARLDTPFTVVPYAKELFAVAPEIAKYVRSLAAEGITKLSDVVDHVMDVLRPEIPDITREDGNALIGGLYNEKEPTKNELSEVLFNLREEARLTDKLADLERGVESKSAEKKKERTRKIQELRDKINDIQKRNRADEKAANKFYPEELSQDGKDLGKAKNNLKSQIKKIEEQIKSGNFSKPEKKEIKWDAEGRELQGKLGKLRQERDIRILKEHYLKRTKSQRYLDQTIEIFNVPRSLMASMDFSAPLNQAFIATLSHGKEAKAAVKDMFKAAASQKKFDQFFYDIKDSHRYELFKDKLKLRLSDPHSPYLTAREDAFMSGYAERIPIAGKGVKASERAYVMYLNKLRWDILNKLIDRYEESGRTYKNSQELYEKAARYVNNITGAGNMGRMEKFAPMFTTLFFSPRLMASRLNLMNPNYYRTLPKELKVQALKDMSQAFGLASAILGSFVLYQHANKNDDDPITVELDPRSPDFAKIRQGNTRWNILGGFQPYMRAATQFASGKKKSANSGIIRDLDGEGPFKETRGTVLGDLLRSKLAPVPDMLWNIAEGENMVGEKTTLRGEAWSHLFPLSIQSMWEGADQYGAGTLPLVGVPGMFGIGVQTYEPRKKEIKREIPYLSEEGDDMVERKAKLTDQQYDEYKKLAEKFIENDLKKLKSMKAFQDLPDAESKQAETTRIENAAVVRARKIIVEKYQSTFEKEPLEKVKKDAETRMKKAEIKEAMEE